MQNTLIDNSENLTLLKYIQECLAKECTELKIATGYWDLPGTKLLFSDLAAFFARGGVLKLLIGQEPELRSYQQKKSDLDEKTFPDFYIQRDINLLSDEYKCVAELLQKYMGENDDSQIQVRVYGQDGEKKFLHAKCYIFNGKNKNDEKTAFGIIGSSNFTKSGLVENAELNYLETDKRIVNFNDSEDKNTKGHNAWFDELWKNSVLWSGKFLKVIGAKFPKKNDSTFALFPPYEAYIKLLIDQFDEIINFDGKIKSDDYMPRDANFKKLSYQKEAVNQGCAIMKKHGGFILSDVVGLGKTFIALMVAKRHLLETGFKTQILIITPPAIKQSWIHSIDYFDRDEAFERRIKPLITLTTIGCIDDAIETEEYIKENDFDSLFKKCSYSMIIVDESHRFRNDGTIMYQKLDNLIGSIVPQPYIILLSATPQNNKPYDLRNQIYLFQRAHNNSTLQNLGEFGNKLENYFSQKQKNYEQYIKKDKIIDGKKIPKSNEELVQDRQNLAKDSEDIRRRVVEPLVIRRTRTDIKKFYEDDMKSQGLHFPKIQKPHAIPYEMKGDLALLFNSTVDIIAPQVNRVDADEDGNPTLDFGATEGNDALGYYRYRAIEFLASEENRKKHEANNLTVNATSKHLAQIMELLLVKRLESSQAAFKESLHNLRRYTQNMIQMWNADRIFICPDFNVNAELSDDEIKKNGSFEECLNVLSEKAKNANKRHSKNENEGANQEYKKSDFDSKYIDLLKNDLRLVDELCEKWDKQNDDPKMETFIRNLNSIMEKSKYCDKNNVENQKLIIFTECIATQKALVKKFQNCASEYNILSITAENRDKMKDVIAANFDANYNGKKEDDYKILITTDVLAEGINLHRANSILNYDSPWNATRLMQRLGRINRIGTESNKIYSYNFYPSTLGDQQINLKNRTYIKLQAFHELFGEDSQIYSTDEKVKSFGKVEHALDEEKENLIMPFISELKSFKKENPAAYEKLLSVSQKICASVSANEKQCFFALHEKSENGALLHSHLYIAGKDGTCEQVGQLEFFEKLKPLSHLDSMKTEIGIFETNESQVLHCYDADKQNAKLSMRSKNHAGKNEINEALKKIKVLYDPAKLSDDMLEKLNEISTNIRNKHSTLIREVLKTDFANDGLGTIQVESDIEHLYSLTKKSAKTNAQVAISFIAN